MALIPGVSVPCVETPGISANSFQEISPKRDSWDFRRSENLQIPPFYLAVVICVSEKKEEKTENKNTNFAGAVSEPFQKMLHP